MNKINPLFTILCLALLFIGCKDNNNSSDQAASSDEATEMSGYNLINDEGYSKDEIEALNESAGSILQHRIDQDSTIWAHIEHQIWAYEFVYQNGKMSEKGDYDGYWIDMDNELKYTYGFKGDQLGSGKYHYSPHTELLLLVDDKSNVKPRQYKAKITGQMMVLAGNPEYRDNGFQSKLVRVDSIPQ